MMTALAKFFATIAGKALAVAVVVALIIAAVLFFTGTLTAMFTAKQEARVAKGQAEASINAGAEAMNTVSNVAASDARTDQTVKGATDEIRSQPAGHSNDAALRALCRMHQYQSQQRCAELRRADSRDASGAGSAR